MDTLFDDSKFRNPAASEIWKRREVDKLLDAYLEGSDLGRIALVLGRNRKAVVRKLQEYIYNERDRVINYKPRRRTSRRGRRITANEKQIILQCRKKGVPDECIARVLMREVSEFASTNANKVPHEELRALAVSTDLVWAYRYLYYCHGVSMVPDAVYDKLEQEEMEFGTGAKHFQKVGSDLKDSYPAHIRALGMYLAFKYAERKKGANTDDTPVDKHGQQRSA